jgi:chaperonin GroES
MAEHGVIESTDFPAAHEGEYGGNGEDKARDPLDLLREYLDADNIADLLSDEELGSIGEKVSREYLIDKTSRKEWEETNSQALKLALQSAESKTYPWPGAANVKYPLLTSAAIQFAARAYPAIVAGKDVVKAKIVGADKDGQKRLRGDRISRHMSWQLTDQMTEWEEDTDKLLHILPISGLCFRKTYYDATLGRNRSELVMPDKLVVNDGARDLETVPRITQELELYPFEIEGKMRSGVFRREEFGPATGKDADEDAPHEFLEQHRLLDLDRDGFVEPYIVTVHKETSKVVRILPNFREEQIAVSEDGEIARIERDQYFTKYGLLPNPTGGFHDIGFGFLLRSINEAANSTLNQLLDAGHLSNLGGGFIGRGARLRGGQIRFKPGEWKPVDVTGGKLRENLVPLPIKEPSNVLFMLLGMLVEAGKDISSVKDVMTGEAQGRNQSPTTTLALIEQGMSVFSAIYKRIFRSLKSEYAKLYRLNARYLDPETYFTVLDEPEAIGPEDYAQGDFDIVPVADPKVVTNMQRLGRAEFLMQFRDDPLVNQVELRQRVFDAASIEDIDELLLEEEPQDPEIAARADEIDLKKEDQRLRGIELQSQISERAAKVLKLIAEAEGVEAGPHLEIYKQEMALLSGWAQAIMRQGENVDQGTVSGVEGQPGDQALSGVPQGAA